MSRTGRVEVVSGPMFAGKTEELLRRVRRAQIAGRHVELISHSLDTRRGTGSVSSHSGMSLPSMTVQSAAEIEALLPKGVALVAIDEAHFFGPELLDVVMRIADRGCVVIVAGLDVTFDARPFEPLPSIGALAERIDKLTAVCTVCGEDAAFHEPVWTTASSSGGAERPAARTGQSTGRAVQSAAVEEETAVTAPAIEHADAKATVAEHVGGSETYQARCRAHLSWASWRA